MPSELDQNFHLRAGDGEEYVLRIVRSEADPAFVEAQVEVLRYLADPLSRVRAGGSRRTDQAGLSTPEVVLSLDGAAIETARLDAENHRVWLVRFLRGKPLAKARPHRPELLKSVGRALGELDLRLAAFSHAAVHRDLCWDLRNAPAVRPLLEHVEDPSRRELVTTRLDRAEDQVLPRLRETRAQVIHNDANDYNILVDTSGTALTGILDFGDMVHTHLVCEPAVAMAYLMMNDSDPISAARHFLAGYQSVCPLTEAELLLLPDLIATRLCVSVVLSAHRRRSRPENAYLTVSEAPAWRLLELLRTLDGDEIGAALAGACTRTNR